MNLLKSEIETIFIFVLGPSNLHLLTLTSINDNYFNNHYAIANQKIELKFFHPISGLVTAIAIKPMKTSNIKYA